MVCNYLLTCLIGISACLLTSTLARQAILNGYVTHHSVYQVSVQIHGYGHVGGGGIIGDKFVLTAAHCVLNRNRHLHNGNIIVLAGTPNLNETGSPALSIRVKKIFFPSEFHPMVEFSHGDVAVLMLVDSLQLERHPQLQKLGFPRNYAIDDEGVMTGYGWDKYNNGIGSSDGRLRIAMVDISTNGECEKNYPLGAIQSDRHLCGEVRAYVGISGMFAAIRHNGVCIGDTGGPLVQNNTVVGILGKLAPHCNEENHPAIYTRVAHYLRMIINVMEHGHDPEMISLNP